MAYCILPRRALGMSCDGDEFSVFWQQWWDFVNAMIYQTGLQLVPD